MTEQLPLTSVQSGDEKLPLTFALKCTAPVGTIGDPASLSITVTVHVVVCVEIIDDGEHTTETETDLVVPVTPTVVELL